MDYLHTIYQQFLSIDNPIINLLMVMVIISIWNAALLGDLKKCGQLTYCKIEQTIKIADNFNKVSF